MLPLNRFISAELISSTHTVWDSTSKTWTSTGASDLEHTRSEGSSSVHKENEELTEIPLAESAQQEGKLSLKKDKTVTLKQIGAVLKEGLQDTMLYRTVNLVCGLFKVMLTNAKMSETFDTRPYTASDIIHGRRVPTTVATAYTCFHHLKILFSKEAVDEGDEGVTHVMPFLSELTAEVTRREAPVPTVEAERHEKEGWKSAAPHDSSPLSKTRSFSDFTDIDFD